MTENPSQIHGRLNEALHVAGYAVERAWSKLEWLLEGERWTEVGPGFEDVNDFMATVQLPPGADPEQRKSIARRIKELQPDTSQRKIAGVLGVSEATVARDMGKSRGATNVAPEEAEATDDEGSDSETATNVAPDQSPPTAEITGTEAARQIEKRAKAKATREAKRAEKIAELEDTEARRIKEGEGVYDVVVIDPPWPMQKIERDERPNQVGLDYPTMTEEEIGAHVEDRAPFADDCHVWIWATHRFLPMAFRLLDRWAVRYVCTFVWHKPGGFQPVGLPQYNCEFALYARRGSPVFVDTKALPTCFVGERGRHSEKPEEFYRLVRRITGGRRYDMFNRRAIEGFDGHGQEAA